LKVLLLSIKAGYGHHSTAKAIMDCFEENGHTCSMLDVFEHVNGHLGNLVQSGYLMSTKYAQGIYNKTYSRLAKKDKPYSMHSPVSYVSSFISRKIEDYVTDFAPDLIIATHSYAAVCATILKNKGIADCPSIGIVTDFTVHPFWESTSLDYYVVPDKLIMNEMQRKGIAAEKLLPLGIPVKKKFSQKTDTHQARKALGIEDMPTILIMMGSMGYGNIKDIISEIDGSPYEFQILCVCGSNKKIKKAVDGFNWNKKVYSYGFVDNVDVMMDASDFLISKPGGLTSSEALAKELPMIVMNPIPGHEVRNLDFLVNNGAAIRVDSVYSISNALNLMFNCPWRLELMRESVKQLSKPNAAADLYDFSAKNLFAKSASI
jgi:processive 1,2-diacylglycerol beta-glucosyltransferase